MGCIKNSGPSKPEDLSLDIRRVAPFPHDALIRPPTMKVIVQNLAIEYQDEGAGPVVLFLHGWMDTLHTFDALVPFLSSQHRVIRVDLPGFGKSETPKEPWGYNEYVRFVKNFVQKLDLDIDTFVGHSFGGGIVIKGVATNELQSHKVVLIGAAGLRKNRPSRKAILKSFAKIGGFFMNIPPLVFWRNALRKKLYGFLGSDYPGRGPLRDTYLRIIAEDLRASAAKISTPTLLVWGAMDNATPLSDGEELSGLIQDSVFAVVEDAGHFVHQEKTKETATHIIKFLR